MRKIKPVITLLAIQLIIAVSLALINPVSDYIVRKKGTEYTFASQDAFLTGDFSDYIVANCYIDFHFDFDRFGYYTENFAVIETDENGLSYISELTDTPPENGDWLGTEEKSFEYFYCFTSDKIDYKSVENSVIESDLFYDYEFTDKYEVTVNVSVYKGRAVLNAILVDGVEIEEFLKTKG